MRIGIIRAGRIGTLHAGVLSANDAVDELVLADIDADRAKSLAEELGAWHLDQPEDLFDISDAIVIASSTKTHVPYLLRAAEAGVPAFCEKPPSIDLETADQAVTAVHESGITAQIGFMRRFDTGHLAVRKEIVSGGLGDVLLVATQVHTAGHRRRTILPCQAASSPTCWFTTSTAFASGPGASSSTSRL